MDDAPKHLGLRLSAYNDSALGRKNGENCDRLLRALDGLREETPSMPAIRGRKRTYSGASRRGSYWDKRLQSKPRSNPVKYHWS
jgi:hypothetical protein